MRRVHIARPPASELSFLYLSVPRCELELFGRGKLFSLGGGISSGGTFDDGVDDVEGIACGGGPQVVGEAPWWSGARRGLLRRRGGGRREGASLMLVSRGAEEFAERKGST